MSLVDVGALVLGLIVAVLLALLAEPHAGPSDPAMKWEGRVAVGFTGLLFAGPFWLAQAGVTVAATFADGGLWSGWLWMWLVAAPLVGSSPPTVRMVRGLRRLLPRQPASPFPPRGVGAVQQEANFAWAATEAAPEWELHLTPALPSSWPPETRGSAVWLCFAERAGTPQVYEVAAPWARITLAPGESAWPVVERLSAAVTSMGVQAIVPVDPHQRTQPTGSHLDLIWHGDPAGRLANGLREWRSRNTLLATHPAAVGHLPPS